MAVEGTCAAGFEGVRDAFAENFAQHGEVGATVAATVDGKLVVDLWGGVRDRSSQLAGAEGAAGIGAALVCLVCIGHALECPGIIIQRPIQVALQAALKNFREDQHPLRSKAQCLVSIRPRSCDIPQTVAQHATHEIGYW